jgi:hypothetical protein
VSRPTPSRGVSSVFALALALTLATATEVAAKGYMTADFKLGKTRGKTLALLPPHAELIKAKAIMTDQLIEEALALETSAATSIAKNFERLGCELQELVKNVSDRYDEEWPKLVRRPKQLKYKRYNLGGQSRELSTMLRVDGLILARIQAVYVTAGKATMSYLFGGATRSYARVDVTALDGDSGIIESYFYGVQLCKKKQLAGDPDVVMTKAFEKLLKNYPAEGEVLKVKKGELDLAAAGEEEDEGEEAVLGDLELLLGAADEEGVEEQEQEEESDKDG